MTYRQMSIEEWTNHAANTCYKNPNECVVFSKDERYGGMICAYISVPHLPVGRIFIGSYSLRKEDSYNNRFTEGNCWLADWR
jgi:hypothetical protein